MLTGRDFAFLVTCRWRSLGLVFFLATVFGVDVLDKLIFSVVSNITHVTLVGPVTKIRKNVRVMQTVGTHTRHK